MVDIDVCDAVNALFQPLMQTTSHRLCDDFHEWNRVSCACPGDGMHMDVHGWGWRLDSSLAPRYPVSLQSGVGLVLDCLSLHASKFYCLSSLEYASRRVTSG